MIASAAPIRRGGRLRARQAKVPVPLVADIERFSLDNGPGIRSTVFLKGCDLRCAWCHNPELRIRQPRVSFRADRCIGCDACVNACLKSPHTGGGAGRCTGCGRCAEACPARALRLIGESMDPDRLASLLLEDLPFYRASGGGVTFSGGEPGLFSEYCAETAAKLKAHGVRIAIQTAGMFPWDPFSNTLFPLLDEIYFDLKLLDPARHRRFTGASNEPILENFRRVARVPGRVTATMVPVQGVNDGAADAAAVRDFVYSCGVTRFRLRPFNKDGATKRVTILAAPCGNNGRMRARVFSKGRFSNE